jgi:urate oxidase
MLTTVELKSCAYGKTGVRVLKIERQGNHHYVKDIDVDIQVYGSFASAYEGGDNRCILPTDTMKNTVYAFVRQAPIGEIECFGLRLSQHFLEHNEHFDAVRISLAENIWDRINCEDKPHDSAFQLSSTERRMAIVENDRRRISVQGAIRDMRVLKTAHSAFTGFMRDEYTVLAETTDRLLGTRINTEWIYNSKKCDFACVAEGVRKILLETFAAHDSQSVQHTLYALGQAVLEKFSCIDEIRLSMPNLHYLLVDLSPFHMNNPNEVFFPIDGPSGLIEATLTRSNGLIS